MSSSVLPANAARSALQLPDNVSPIAVRAVQVPSHAFAVFRADHVPCKITSPESLNSVQEPPAAFRLGPESSPDHIPRKYRSPPVLANQLPRNVGAAPCRAWKTPAVATT